MNEEATNTSLSTALVAAQQSAQAVAKGSKNSFHNYKYASSEAVIEEAREALTASGLSVIPLESSLRHEGEGYILVSQFAVCHVSGERVRATYETPVVPEKGRPLDKATAAARTYALAYFLRDLLLLPRVEEGAEVDRRDDRGYAPRGPAKARDESPDMTEVLLEYSTKTKALADITAAKALYRAASKDARLTGAAQAAILNEITAAGERLKENAA